MPAVVRCKGAFTFTNEAKHSLRLVLLHHTPARWMLAGQDSTRPSISQQCKCSQHAQKHTHGPWKHPTVKSATPRTIQLLLSRLAHP